MRSTKQIDAIADLLVKKLYQRFSARRSRYYKFFELNCGDGALVQKLSRWEIGPVKHPDYITGYGSEYRVEWLTKQPPTIASRMYVGKPEEILDTWNVWRYQPFYMLYSIDHLNVNFLTTLPNVEEYILYLNRFAYMNIHLVSKKDASYPFLTNIFTFLSEKHGKLMQICDISEEINEF